MMKLFTSFFEKNLAEVVLEFKGVDLQVTVNFGGSPGLKGSLSLELLNKHLVCLYLSPKQ